MGTQSSIKALRSGHAQLLVVAHNCPPLRNAELAYYAMISRTPVHNFNGTNVCRPHPGQFPKGRPPGASSTALR